MRAAQIISKSTVVSEPCETATHQKLEQRIDAILEESGMMRQAHPFDRKPQPITPAELVRCMAPYLSLN